MNTTYAISSPKRLSRVLRHEDVCLAACTTILASIAVFYGAWEVWRAFQPLEISYNEGWNAWHAQAAMALLPLYPQSGALVANNYPPLSFFAVGLFSRISGLDLILAGRLLALLGLTASAGAVAAIIRGFGSSRLAAVLGVAWYAAMLTRFCPQYIGMNDPNFLSLGVMSWALWLVLRQYRAGKSLTPAIGLMIVAGFIKHSLLATPAAVFLWLLVNRDYREAGSAAVWSAVLLIASFSVCVGIFGWNFIEQMFHYQRHFQTISSVAFMELRQLAVVAIPLLAAVLLNFRSDRLQGFLATFTATGFALYVIARRGDGIEVNVMFELLVAIAIAVPVGLERLRTSWFDRYLAVEHQRKLAALGLLAAFLYPSGNHTPYLFWTSRSFHEAAAAKIRASEAEIIRLRTAPGPVYCPVMTMCFRAGKAFEYDAFAMYQRVKAGYWTPAQLEARLRSAKIRQDPNTAIGAWNYLPLEGENSAAYPKQSVPA